MRISMKKPVTYLGYQEGVGLLVNEVDSHSTVAYDEEKHCIVEGTTHTRGDACMRQSDIELIYEGQND